VQTSAIDAYREHCRKSLERFATAADPNTAHRIAKDCLILVSSGADLKTVAGMADTSLTVDTNHTGWPAFASTKGLADYREGNFTGAVDWSERVLLRNSQLDNAAWLQVETYAVLAMARFQLNQVDPARLALGMGQEIADTKLPKLESGDLEEGWLDWIFGHALLREARQVIEEKAE
jgi:hypothetical protein